MLYFKDYFVVPVLLGEKTQARRLSKKAPVKVGEKTEARVYPGSQPFATLEVLDVREERIGDITQEDALAEGYATREAFLYDIRRIYRGKLPEIGWTDEYVWVVTFRVSQITEYGQQVVAVHG